MATKKTPNVTTTTNIFAEPEVAEVVEETIVDDAPVVVAPGAPAQKKARVKGSWTMFWGTSRYDFEDGKNYTLPADLHAYLQAHGNIYDTL